ncbi:hypothetical protein AAFP35_11660 [Gordonia sp. CPCC 206044]|uniref:hypothetical protein n=1 Tax=Gordonia sp. CPCC 206044 TaxID=3140793 RepID=UPI003AF3F062
MDFRRVVEVSRVPLIHTWILETDYRPFEIIEQSIAARSGGPAPSGRQSRSFQERVLKEILAAA